MCKRVSLTCVIENGLLQLYDLYFQQREIDPNSVSVLLDYSPQQQSYQLQDPIYGTWKRISDDIYHRLVDGKKKKFPGRRTK